MRQILATLALLVLFCSAAPRAWAEKYKDEKLGFEFVHPKGWERMPLSADERWLVAKFHCDREYEVADEQGFYTSVRPSIDVVVIAKALQDADGARVRKTDDGVKVLKEAPWKDLKGYLEEHCKRYGGFHFSAESEDEINGMKVRLYEVTVDKLVTGKRLVYGWEFEIDDAYFGLVGHFLADDAKKLGKEIERSFRSFKTFARTGTLPNSARTGEDIVIEDETREDDTELSEEDLKKRRDQRTRRAFDKIKAGLDDSWRIEESDNYIAVSHADKKYTKEVLDHAEALRAWFEEELGFFGSGYVGRVIIRICKDYDEYAVYNNSRGWFSDSPEIVTYEDKDGANYSLNGELYDAWIKDKNDELRIGLPQWIDTGLTYHIQNARSKGRKIEFKAAIWDKQEVAILRRDGQLLNARQFFQMTSNEMFQSYDNSRQCEFFVCFLLEGAASKSSKYKHLFGRYVKNLIIAMEEEAAKADAAAGDEHKEPTTEEEEDAMFRARQQAWREKEKDLLNVLVQRTFEGWTDKDWEKFDRLYEKDLK